MSSPTSRTLKLLESLGWEVGIVERYNSFIKRRFDLFEFADLVGIAHPHPPGGIVAIQVTSSSNHAARRNKIKANPKALKWLQAGGHIWIASWGKKKNKWVPRLEIITSSDFESMI